MSSVEIINNKTVRNELDGLDADEIYARIVSGIPFEDLERHLSDDGNRIRVPVDTGIDDGLDEVLLHPVTGRGSFEHYEGRDFYSFAFDRDAMEMYREKGLPELIPKEELIGNSVQGVYAILDNDHKAMMTDFQYQSNWGSKNKNEVEAIYEASKKVYSAIDKSIDDTAIDNKGYDIDISSVQDELYEKLNSVDGDSYEKTLEKLARIPEVTNKGKASEAAWTVTKTDRFLGRIDRDYEKEDDYRVVIEEIVSHNKNQNTGRNHHYGGS